MLQKEFFQVQPFNPNPYWDPVIVNLSGAQKFEEDTIFKPGKYRIEVAPGLDSLSVQQAGDSSRTNTYKTFYVNTEELITERFIVRAYCGSNAAGDTVPGQNLYNGPFKVNAVDARTLSSSNRPNGVDVTHIFGAGGGNGYTYTHTPFGDITTYSGGGANCLGNGNISIYDPQVIRSTGAGSCLHLLPVGGVFGTDYIRAYHLSPVGTSIMGCGGAYGGGATVQNDIGGWFTRGGNSPHGNGATTINTSGNGIGGGKVVSGTGAIFNGTVWANATQSANCLTNGVLGPNSHIRITYLGPLD